MFKTTLRSTTGRRLFYIQRDTEPPSEKELVWGKDIFEAWLFWFCEFDKTRYAELVDVEVELGGGTAGVLFLYYGDQCFKITDVTYDKDNLVE